MSGGSASQLGLGKFFPYYLLVEERSRQTPTPTVEDCIEWLVQNGLTWEGHSYRAEVPENSAPSTVSEWLALGMSCERGTRLKRDELKAAEQRLRARQPAGWDPTSVGNRESVWDEHRHAAERLSELDLRRMPVDALGFYRFFHCAPHGEWGIYILVDDSVLSCVGGL